MFCVVVEQAVGPPLISSMSNNRYFHFQIDQNFSHILSVSSLVSFYIVIDVRSFVLSDFQDIELIWIVIQIGFAIANGTVILVFMV